MAGPEKSYALNSVFLKNRIAELGIKQWWLAEQVGVDRKTVVRWVQGKVKSIQPSNVKALAEILDCKLGELTLDSEADQLATIEDQKNAAKLIASSSLIEKLGPIGEWNVIESLLKATIVPQLPLNILGELYDQLTIASWRQSKMDAASLFNEKTEEIAKKSGDKALLAAALLSKANLLSWKGKTAQSIQTYKDCLKFESYLEKKTIGSIYSNLGAVLYESGDLDSGEHNIKKAIQVFDFHGKPMNLSIAWCHLSMIHLKKGQVDCAQSACEKSIRFAKQDDYRRGSCMGDLIRAEVFALQGQTESAMSNLQKGLDGFEKLGIQEGLNYEFAGRVCRLVKEFQKSVDYLRQGLEISGAYPLYQAALYLELSKTLMAKVDKGRVSEEASANAKKAKMLFTECEAPIYAEVARQLILDWS